ncbi:substrate-binding periplasmic protein [Bdellovibrio sp. BCCA]|uniref:substrate-binding periplasmic protein n=1 Tax=Bdellovibrio sp. BCCA TaxID=3136281 RepID=UPI0030F2E2E4
MSVLLFLFGFANFSLATPLELKRGENYFVIGVGEYDYLPHTGFVKGRFAGFGEAVLTAFAKAKGYTFEYKAVSIPRMFKVFLEDATVDFMYPNNEYWDAEHQRKKGVLFSSPVVTYVDGIVVRPENKKISLAQLKSIGIIKGFDPIQYKDLVKEKKIKMYEHSDVVALLKMVLNKRVQGAYLNPLVAAYYLKTHVKSDEMLVLADKLPFINSSYYFSTIKYSKVLEEFDEFLKKERSFFHKLKIQYGVQDPFLKDPKKYTPPLVSEETSFVTDPLFAEK